MRIIRPSLVVQKDIALKNIERMQQKAQNSAIQFRPHFKTHQSIDIGRWFKGFGVEKIAVSSLTMAHYFSSEWNDILVAIPVNILEIELINQLASTIYLSLVVENNKAIDFLIQNLTSKVNIYIKIDLGYHRTGIDIGNLGQIAGLKSKLEESDKINFVGFLSHAGNTYHAKNKKEILSITTKSLDKLSLLKQKFGTQYIYSYGDTPGLSSLDEWTVFNEARPGNFIFYDAMQWQMQTCEFSDIAVGIVAPIIAKHSSRGELVLYLGAVHLSKEYLLTKNSEKNYGFVCLWENEKWSSPMESTFIKSVSQEHAIIKTDEKTFQALEIGNLLCIIPVHSCLSIQNMRQIYVENDVFNTFNYLN